ncbi:MAG: Ig-like domain repeat protein [Nocardioidaceae bacterium]|nr:Ig-like domain repeat protein [Nocardioidaceae bacterium]
MRTRTTGRPTWLTAALLPVVLVATGLSLVTLPAAPAKADPPPPSVSQRYADNVLADNPAVYYRLDDATAGFARDSSGNFRDGSHGANVTPGVDGMFPSSAADDLGLANAGPDWALQGPSTGLPVGSSAKSLEFWFKTTSSADGWLASYDGYWGVYKDQGSRLTIDPPGCCGYIQVTPTWSITDGAWHQVVLTTDGSSGWLFVDGQLIGSSGGVGWTAGASLRVGQVAGSYDEVAVYSKRLSANQVAGRWAVATMPTSSVCPAGVPSGAYASAVMADAPEVYLRGSEVLSEPGGRTVLDHSGHCRHATLGPTTDQDTSTDPRALEGDNDPALKNTDRTTWAISHGGDGLPTGSSPKTLEFWFKTTQAEDGWLASYDDYWRIYKDLGSRLTIDPPGCCGFIQVTPTWSIIDGAWHQIVLTTDGGSSWLYLDGQLVGSSSGVGWTAGASPRVGQVAGSYDEVAIYSKKLSADEVNERWAIARRGPGRGCPAAGSSGHAGLVIDQNPELYLRLGDLTSAAGNRVAYDSSGKCRHAEYAPGVTGVPAGAPVGDDDGAVESSAAGQWALSRGPDGLPVGSSPKTLEFWFKTTQAADGWLASYDDYWRIYKDFGSRLTVDPPGCCGFIQVTPTSSIIDGAWHQLVLTSDGSSSWLYLDGHPIGSSGGVGWTSGANLHVGQVAGSYDEVAVYSKTFSAAEVSARWDQSRLQETTLSLDADPADWEEGAQVTLTATVDAPHPLSEAPTGTVTFVDGSTTLDTVPLGANGKATYSGTFAAGNHSIVARYSGDTRYVGSRNRPALDHVVSGVENTTTALQVQPAGGAYGTGLQATATVSGSGAGGASPGGFVVFYVDGARVGTGELAEGQASVTLPLLEPRTATVKAVYGGDAVFATSADQEDVEVTRAAKVPVLEVSPSPAAATEPVRLAVTVPRAGAGSKAATGSVQISSESGPVATVALGANGTGVVFVDDLPIGTHTLIAAYPGDARYAPRDSAPVDLTVAKATTTTTLLNTPEPAPVGKRVTLSAQVRATRPTTAAATGTVTFLDGTTALGQAILDAAGDATLTVDDLALGQHRLTARYAGDARNLASVSTERISTIVPAVAVTLTAPGVVKVGESTAVVVTVAPGTGQGPTPTGTVTVKAGDVVLGTATLNAEGKGTVTTSFATAGGRELTADYAGSSRYGFGATESPTHLDVVPAATTTTLTSTPNPAGEGAAVTYKVNVKAVAPGGGVPQGYVVLALDGGTIATVQLDGAGNASFTDVVRPQGIYQVKATYGGSANHDPSMSSVLTQYVSPRTETTLTSTPNPSVLGNAVTFTATVDAVDLETTPPGTVTFTTPTATLGSASIGADGKATITVNDLAVGTYAVTATYAGGSGYGQSASAPYSHVVKRVATQTALVLAPTSSVNGQTVTMTATVTPDVQTYGTPTGSVTFKAGANPLGTVPLQANGKAVLPKKLDAGTYSVTATYGGNDSYDTSTSAAVEQVVAKADVTVGVVAAPSPSAESEPVDVTVTVAPVAPGEGSPSGTITLTNDGAAVGSAALANGTASFQLTPASGDHVLKASYTGDDHFGAQQSAEVTHHVGHATTTTLAASPQQSVWGQPVTLTATVASSGGTPAGTVVFKDGTTALGQAQLDGNGHATLQTTDLAAGNDHDLVATFAGAGDYASSTSAGLDYTVAPAPTTLTLAAAPATPVYGQQVTLTATLAVAPPGRGPPAGFVSFFADGTAIGTATIHADGTATLVTSGLRAGTRALSAAYGGTDENGSSTGTKSLTLGKAAPYTFVVPTPNPSVLGTQVTFRIVPDAPYAGTPTGSVTLYDGTTALGTRTLDANGEAKISTSTLTQGAHQMRAEYSGDDNFLGGSSPVVSQQVNPGLASTITLTSSQPGGTAFGEQVTFTATVAGGTSPAPTGYVTFTDNGQSVGTVTIDGNGQARLVTQLLTVGSHQIGASYGGDGYYFSASATPVAHTVTPSRQLFFVGQAQQLTAGVTSSPYTVRLENRDGPVVAGAGGLVVTLQSSAVSGRFLDGSGTQITQVTIPAGASTTTFRYRDTKAGDPFLAVSALPSTGVGPRTQQQHVVPGPLDHLALTPASKAVTPGGGQDYQADGRDAWDNSRGDVTGNATFTISPSGSCSGARCTVGAAGDYTVHGSLGAATGTASLVSDNPPVPVLSADVTSGVEALDVTFDIAATDVDGDDLTWTIDYGDGSPRTQPQPLPAGGTTVTHTYLECHSCVAVLHVSDGKADPAPNATLKIDVARNDALFQANAGDPVVVEVNRPAQLDGSASLPGSPLIQSYTWNFGDGHQSAPSANAVAQHTYAAPGDYVATLTVAGHGRTSSSQVPVTVTLPAGGGAVVAVTSDGQPLVGATVVVKDSGNATYRAIPTDPGSYRIDGLPDGTVTAYVAAPGYRPATTSITVSGGAGFASLALERGEVGASELTTKRLTPDEAIDLGIDPEAPGNQNIFQFEINLSFEDTTVSVSGVSTGHSFVNPTCNGADCSGGSGWIAVPYSGGGYVVAYPGGDRILWIVIPGQAKWLKEMFDVQLMVTNLSDEAFTFEDGTATLDLPSGLSLADMSGPNPQTLAQPMDDVPGGQSRSVHWIVRGDVEGEYTLDAHYSGVLQPVGTPVQLDATTDEANRIKVWGGSALRMTVDVDDKATMFSPYDLSVSLTNVSDVPVYNPMVTLLPQPQDEHRPYVFQPRQQFDQAVDRIEPGETFTTRDYTVLTDFTGNLNLAQSYVLRTGGNQFIPNEIVAHPPDPQVPTMSSTNTSAGIKVSWQPANNVPGETVVGYQVYATPFVSADFQSPLAQTSADQLSATIPYEKDGYGVVAVSTLFLGADGKVHNRLDHKALTLSGFSFDIENPCAALGDAPNGGLPGNYVTSSEDLTVTTPGPKLQVTRTYNSSSDREGWFGTGWTSDYEMSSHADGQGNVAVVLPDGRCLYFMRDPQDLSSFLPPPGEYAHLATDGHDGYVFTSKDRTEFAFDTVGEIGRLQTVTDVDGRRLDLDYGPDPLATKVRTVTDRTTNRSLTFEWNGDGHVSAVKSDPVTTGAGVPAALVWKYYYDDGGRLEAACDPRDNAETGSCTRYEHDPADNEDRRITKVVNPEGNTDAALAYDDKGRVTSRKDGLGKETKYRFPEPPEELDDVTDRMVTTSPLGHETVTDYDKFHRVVSVKTPGGGTTAYGYDQHGYPKKVTDANGHVRSFVYDGRGNVLQQTNGEGETTWMTYDSHDNLSTVRDGRSSSGADDRYLTTLSYDDQSHLVEQKAPATSDQPTGASQTWAYTPGDTQPDGTRVGTKPASGGGFQPPGLVAAEVDAEGATTQHEYDRNGALQETVSSTGLVTSYTYDELGRKLSETVTDASQTPPTSATTSYTYDVVGNLLTTTAPAVTNAVTGATHRLRTTSTYDRNDNVTEVRAADLTGGDVTRTTSYAFDADDRVTDITDAEGKVTGRRYDADGNVVKVIDANQHTLEAEYDADSRPTKVTQLAFTDGLGGAARDIVVARYGYDAGGRRVTVTDPQGRVRRYAYDDADRQVTETLEDYADPDGTTRDVVLEQRAYDGAGQVVSTTSGSGLRTVIQNWNAAGRLASTVLDPGGLNRTTTYAYDKVGNVRSQAQSQPSDGRTEKVDTVYNSVGLPTKRTVVNGTDDLVTTFGYDRRGNLVTTKDPVGNITDYRYDELNRRIAELRPQVDSENVAGTVTNGRPTIGYGFNTFGDATQVVDPRGRTTTTAFDRLGRETTITHPGYTPPGGQQIVPVERYEYDNVGNLAKVTDRRGLVTDYTFDAMNRVTRQTDPLLTGQSARGTTGYEYDDAGNLLATVDPRGARREATYDALNQVRTRTDVVRRSGGVVDRYTSRYTYDDLGDLLTEENPLHDVVRYGYSPASEMVSVTDEAGKVTTIQRDVAGRAVRTTDPLGRAQLQQFDDAGRLKAVAAISSTGAELARTRFDLDGNGNVVKETRPEANTIGFTYDSNGRLTRVDQQTATGVSAITRFGYDVAGNQTRLTDGRDNVTAYTYNAWNLREDTVEPSTSGQTAAADRTFTTSYDAAGLPVKETQPNGITINRTFDELGNLVVEAGTSTDATIPAARRDFGYDKAGVLSSAGPATARIDFAFDDRGLLTSATGPSGSSSYQYDAAGQMLSRTDASGTSSFTWDSRGNLKTAQDPLTGVTATNTYDDASQLLTTSYTGGASRALTWDQQGRLTGDTLKKSDGTISASTTYGYDKNDNLTSQTITQSGNSAAGAYTYGYDLADRIVSWTKGSTTKSYVYDAAGNRTKVNGTVYSYDARNRVTNQGIKTLSWDARGTLDRQSQLGVPQAIYEYDALGRTTKVTSSSFQPIPLTYDSLDRVTSRRGVAFAYEGLNIDPVSDGATLISRDPSGAPMAQKTGTGTPSLIRSNRHGDLTALFSGNGTVNGSRVYEPYGEVAGTTGTASPLGFQGDYTDATTHDLWMGARWYLPDVGTFTARDTVFGQLRTPITLNRYTYAGNNPLSMFDADGHDFDPIGWVNTHIVQPIGNAFSSGWNAVTGFISGVAHGISSAYGMAQSVYNAARAKVSAAISRAQQQITHMIDVARRAGAAFAQQNAALAKVLKQGAEIILPMVAGAVVTGGCMYFTAGAATPACLMAGGAAAGALSGASQCDGMNSACFRRVAVEAAAGAVTGLFGGSGGSVLRYGGRLLAGAEGVGLRTVARQATVAAEKSTLLGTMVRGGSANAVYDSIVQVGTTGTIDFKQVGDSFVSGAVLAGSLHLGASGARRQMDLRGLRESAELKANADAVHTALGHPRAMQMRTTAVVRARKPNGELVDVYASSGTRGLTRAQKEAVGELGGVPAENIAGDAETTALAHIDAQQWKPVAGGVSRPSCPICTNDIMDDGALFAGPLARYRFLGRFVNSQSQFYWRQGVQWSQLAFWRRG